MHSEMTQYRKFLRKDYEKFFCAICGEQVDYEISSLRSHFFYKHYKIFKECEGWDE